MIVRKNFDRSAAVDTWLLASPLAELSVLTSTAALVRTTVQKRAGPAIGQSTTRSSSRTDVQMRTVTHMTITRVHSLAELRHILSPLVSKAVHVPNVPVLENQQLTFCETLTWVKLGKCSVWKNILCNILYWYMYFKKIIK